MFKKRNVKLKPRDEVKLVLLGESGCGKTSISWRLVRNEFCESMNSTIGASFMTLPRENIRYMVWDTAGQERFKAIVNMYYRDAELVLLVFDLNRPNSIDTVKEYLEKIRSTVRTEYRIIIIGNKLDLIFTKEELNDVDLKVNRMLREFEDIRDKIDLINISTKTTENYEFLLKKIDFLGNQIVQTRDFDDDENEIITIDNKSLGTEKTYLDFCAC